MTTTDIYQGLLYATGEEVATHSSILAWKIPWIEEPSGLQFLGSQRVGHNLEKKTKPCLASGLADQ